MPSQEEKIYQCEVTPRTESSAKTPFVKISTSSYTRPRIIPLEKPIWLTKAEINLISSLSEPTSIVERASVKDIMEKYRVTEEIANEMLKDDTFNRKIKKKYLYKVTLLRKSGLTEKEVRAKKDK